MVHISKVTETGINVDFAIFHAHCMLNTLQANLSSSRERRC